MLILGTILVVAPSAFAAAPRYSVEVIASGGTPRGINESGQVVGWIGSPPRPFIYTDGAGLVELRTPGYTQGTAWDVNDGGAVAGTSGDQGSASSQHAVRWSGGSVEDLGALEASGTSEGRGINGAGHVVGSASVGFGTHAFLFTDEDGMVDLAPNLFQSVAHDVNDSGQVVGYANSIAFRWSGGRLQSLGVPEGFAYSFGFAINESGQVAGSVKTSPGNTERIARYSDGIGWEILGGAGSDNKGFGINRAGTVVGRGLHASEGPLIPSALAYFDELGLFNLNELTPDSDWGLNAAYDINDAGQIVASATHKVTGEPAAVRLTPVPSPASCMGVPVTIVGTAASETLTGTSGDDVIVGLGGDDVILAGGGNDLICGGEGNDTLFGHAGDDTLAGGAGNDILRGGDGSDAQDGGAGNDILYEERTANGSDSLVGGEGYDAASYQGRSSRVVVSLDGAANDGDPAAGEQDNVRASIEAIYGGAGNDSLSGSSGPDRLYGFGGDDTLDGGAGNDYLIGGAGADTLTGGAGLDYASYSWQSAGVAVRLDGIANDGTDADGDGIGEEGDNVDTEGVFGSSGDDLLVGDAQSNRLHGLAGNDTVDGGAGPDRLEGGPGTDTVTYASRSVRVVVSLDGNWNDGTDSDGNGVSEELDNVTADVEKVIGGSGGDRLVGNGAANVLDGRGGADGLIGGAGSDTLIGGEGDDTFSAADGEVDDLDGGAGSDGGTWDSIDRLVGIP